MLERIKNTTAQTSLRPVRATRLALALGCLLLSVPRAAHAALAAASGGSGYSADLSHNLTIRHQQLICDPTAGGGSASVTYDASMASLYSIYNEAGYDITFENVGVLVGGVKEVQPAAQFFAATTPLPQWGYVQVGWSSPNSAMQGADVMGGMPIQTTTVVANTAATSNIVTGLTTTGLFQGEGVSNPVFPAGTVITSVGSNSIVVSNPANATTSGNELTFSGLAFDGTMGPVGANTFGLEFNYMPTVNTMPVAYGIYAEKTGYPMMDGSGTSPTDFITDPTSPGTEITDIAPANLMAALPEPSMGLFLVSAVAVLASGRGLRRQASGGTSEWGQANELTAIAVTLSAAKGLFEPEAKEILRCAQDDRLKRSIHDEIPRLTNGISSE